VEVFEKSKLKEGGSEAAATRWWNKKIWRKRKQAVRMRAVAL
jgi:hypothetical protein